MHDIDISQLDNGLTVATCTMAHIKSVVLGIWIKTGSRNETAEQHGIAHLLEHMAFKGTNNRSSLRIVTDIENVGGEINASTNVETTAYFARVLRNDMPLAIDILCDIISNPKFEANELEREKQVILQEIGAAHDTPDDIVFDYFTETAFQYQMIGRSILGTTETIKGFTSDDLHLFMKIHYSADRIVVVATGAIEHGPFVHEIEQRLGILPLNTLSPLPEPANYVGGDCRENRDLMDTQVLLGFKGCAYHTCDFYALQLLSTIMGGGMSSRLFQQMREKLGLCYSIYAFHWGFSDIGLFGIYAATDKKGLAKLIPVILDELHKVTNYIDEQEMTRAKAQYHANLVMAQENPVSRANHIAQQILFHGRLISDNELSEQLTFISSKHLIDLAQKLFFNTKPTLAIVGSSDELLPFDEIEYQLSRYHQIPV
ncbi:MAG: Peptidase M16 family protein [Candidatus Tokpelaia sp. JSC188]|nr:MAG: Peptidase M16 family protein [Candidatus Tokpelaia sp. JSC188]